MGQSIMRRAPKYVHGFIDRHGKPRFYFRRRGFKKVPLPGLPWAPEFMAAYEAAMAGQPQSAGSGRAKPGTLDAAFLGWLNSPSFKNGRKPITQSTYRNIGTRFCDERDKNGERYGSKPIATMQRAHIEKIMEARLDKPDSANGLLKVLKPVMQHAVREGLRADDPTRGIKPLPIVGDGYHSWSEDEIALFEARHPIGTKPRLAFALLLYSGQRRSDVVVMGKQHVRDGVLHIVQSKTGAEVFVPVHPELAAIIAATPSEHLTFLTTAFGKGFTAAGFGNWFREQCDAAGLKNCSAHGLRKAAARRLAEAGCTPHEISAVTGHASLREVERYTKAFDRQRAAKTAMGKFTGTSSGQPAEPLAKKSEKA